MKQHATEQSRKVWAPGEALFILCDITKLWNMSRGLPGGTSAQGLVGVEGWWWHSSATAFMAFFSPRCFAAWCLMYTLTLSHQMSRSWISLEIHAAKSLCAIMWLLPVDQLLRLTWRKTILDFSKHFYYCFLRVNRQVQNKYRTLWVTVWVNM